MWPSCSPSTLPLVIGGAGLGVETGYWYFRALRLQSATDTAAYAAAIEARAGSSKTTMTTAAAAAVAENGYDPAVAEPAGDLSLRHPDRQRSGAGGDHLARRTILFQVFSEAPVTITKAAIARFDTAASACILALDPSAKKSVLFSGSSKLSLTGCNVMANSVSNDAVFTQGAATLTTPCIMSGGGAVLTAGVTLTSCKSPMTNLPPVADPFKAVSKPLYPDKCSKSTGATLKPGLYCGGLDLKGDVTLEPGVYVVDGGTLKINANALIQGSGVTFYFTNSATVDINGSAEVNLSAPTSGDYSGMLFFGDPLNHDGSNKFNGTAKSLMTGAIYFPSQAVEYLGNFSGLNGCTQVVAKTVEWTGNTSVAVDCSAHGMETIPVTTIVQLAG